MAPNTVQIKYGVQIGFIGDITDKLLINGNRLLFSSIGSAMFRMQIEGPMVDLFTGELGNMISGNISTNVSNNGIHTDITAPEIINETKDLSIQSKAIKMNINLHNWRDGCFAFYSRQM